MEFSRKEKRLRTPFIQYSPHHVLNSVYTKWQLDQVWWKMCLKKQLYFWKTKIYIWMMFDLYKYLSIDLSAKKDGVKKKCGTHFLAILKLPSYLCFRCIRSIFLANMYTRNRVLLNSADQNCQYSRKTIFSLKTVFFKNAVLLIKS